MDRTDWHILEELRADARLSVNGLSRRANVTTPSTGDRLRGGADRLVANPPGWYEDPTVDVARGGGAVLGLGHARKRGCGR